MQETEDSQASSILSPESPLNPAISNLHHYCLNVYEGLKTRKRELIYHRVSSTQLGTLTCSGSEDCFETKLGGRGGIHPAVTPRTRDLEETV